MTSAMLTPRVSARSLTTTGLGSSTMPAGRTGAVSVRTPPGRAPVRFRCGRGPRRGRYQFGGIVHLEFERSGHRLGTERPLDGRRTPLGVLAGRIVTDIGPAARYPA